MDIAGNRNAILENSIVQSPQTALKTWKMCQLELSIMLLDRGGLSVYFAMTRLIGQYS